ncbi:hypothetical protein LEP1GSC061_0990 [Leptospira wolffii serovar Khorat str. Khorat-H2]|nr:hypothetical protein LEP1GSC061_0990 [Leptospira wolffii serovar Khorat str. Khorat-H2]
MKHFNNIAPFVLLCFGIPAVLFAIDLDRPPFPALLYPGPVGCLPKISEIRSRIKFASAPSVSGFPFWISNFIFSGTTYSAELGYPSNGDPETPRCRQMYPGQAQYCEFPFLSICSLRSQREKPVCRGNPDYDMLINGPGPEGGFIVQYQFNSRSCQFYVEFGDEPKIEMIWRYSDGIRHETFTVSGGFLNGRLNDRQLSSRESWSLHAELIPQACSFRNLEPLRALCL